jgi:hypothetical protein
MVKYFWIKLKDTGSKLWVIGVTTGKTWMIHGSIRTYSDDDILVVGSEIPFPMDG